MQSAVSIFYKSNMIKINLSKLVKSTLLITSIFLIGVSTIAGSFNANARQQEIKNQELFNNPESILNVTFKDNVYLDNIIDNELNPDKNWQGLKFDSNTFGITSISGLSNIGGQDEMISINEQFNTRTIKKNYNDKLQELIVKIDDIKNNGSTIENLSDEGKKEVKEELDKMNGFDLKRQRYWNWSQSKILSISLVGNTNTLNSIKTILEKSGHAKELVLMNNKELKKESDKIQELLKNKSENDKIAIIKDLLQSELEKIGKNEDLDKVAYKEYNALPEYIKNPIQFQLEESTTNSIESVTFKTLDNLVNGTKAKAGLPAWLGGVSGVAGFISFRINYYFWTTFAVCVKNLGGCAKLVLDTITYGFTGYQIWQEFRKMQ